MSSALPLEAFSESIGAGAEHRTRRERPHLILQRTGTTSGLFHANRIGAMSVLGLKKRMCPVNTVIVRITIIQKFTDRI
jgi:hypothetical protein